MLKSLSVKNYTLIELAEIEFSTGLNIITGETGAGKSLLLGALNAILGARMSPDSVRRGADKCIIEGEFLLRANLPQELTSGEDFDLDGDVILIRREYTPAGRTRCFINDSPVTVRKLAEIGAFLVDLCGQHEHQMLLNPDNHLEYLDRFAGLMPRRDEFASLYRQYRNELNKLHQLQRDQRELALRQDRIEFELKEIRTADPQTDEEQQLLADEKELQHGEQIIEFCYNAEEELTSKPENILDSLNLLLARSQKFSEFSADLRSIFEDLNSAAASLQEALRNIVGFRSRFDFTPEKLEEIRQRLGELSQLKRKFGGSIEAVLKHREELKNKRDSFTGLENEILQSGDNVGKLHADLVSLAVELSRLREQAVPLLKKKMEQSLAGLGFTHLEFAADVSKIPGNDAEIAGAACRLTPSGADYCEIAVSTNKGEPLKPLKDIASGGEISRVMLGLKSAISGRDKPGALIFDEIDNGIAGRIARKVGLRLHETSKNQQLIVVTHLPQIASLPGKHLSVAKIEENGRVVSRFSELDPDQRVAEIASLLTTGESAGKGENYARELLSANDTE